MGVHMPSREEFVEQARKRQFVSGGRLEAHVLDLAIEAVNRAESAEEELAHAKREIVELRGLDDTKEISETYAMYKNFKDLLKPFGHENVNVSRRIEALVEAWQGIRIRLKEKLDVIEGMQTEIEKARARIEQVELQNARLIALSFKAKDQRDQETARAEEEKRWSEHYRESDEALRKISTAVGNPGLEAREGQSLADALADHIIERYIKHELPGAEGKTS